MGPSIDTISREAPILIAGPTASGKSDLAMRLAERDGRVIVNADALQVYDCWRILTARPSEDDERAAPHRLYGHISRRQNYSVGHWLREVEPLLAQRVVIVGGTGLYFMALIEGLAEIPPVPLEIRQRANDLRVHHLAEMIAQLDQTTAARIDLNNPVRVQRAWEVLQATGRGLAHWQNDTPAPLLPRSGCDALVVRPDVDWLNARIDRRFDAMIALGALDEAQAALDDWDPTLPSAKAIGAPELVNYLRGQCNLAEAIADAKLSSRQYAKRQRTWFRNRMKDWTALSPR